MVSAVLMYTWIQICRFSHSPSLDFLPLSLQPHPILSSILPPPLYVTSWLFSALFPVLSTPTKPPGSCCLVALKIRIARLNLKKKRSLLTLHAVAFIVSAQLAWLCFLFFCPWMCQQYVLLSRTKNTRVYAIFTAAAGEPRVEEVFSL